MEGIMKMVPWLALVLVAFIRSRARRAPSARSRPKVAGVLVVPVSLLSVACLARSEGKPSCSSCPVRQYCMAEYEVPAVEENGDRPGGVANGPDLASDLERVGRFIEAVEGLQSRLAELLTLLPTQQVVRFLARLVRLVLAHVTG